MTGARFSGKISDLIPPRWPTQTNLKKRLFALNCRLCRSRLQQNRPIQMQNRVRLCESSCRFVSHPILRLSALQQGRLLFQNLPTRICSPPNFSSRRVSHFGTKFAFFGTQKRDSAHCPHAGPALPAAPNGSDEKNSTAYRHATHRAPERVERSGASRGKCNAPVLGASRRFRRHFDYSDLDLPFLKQWTIPPLSPSMNPILTAK